MNKNWQRRLLERLDGFAAPRVVSLSDLSALTNDIEKGLHIDSVRRFAQSLQASGVFKPVRQGLWLNGKALPSPAICEAAQRIRASAVVSLQSVLGDAGVLNNYSSQVHCVISSKGGHGVASISIEAGGTIFHFKQIKDSVLEGAPEEDRLMPFLPYRRATPEAALVHWMYLAGVNRSSMSEPDTQCDVSVLDMDRLERLADIAGVKEATFDWIERCREREELDDEQSGWHGPA